MIVWLASYPRSGNTLLRTILQHAFGVSSYSVYDDPYDIGANPSVAELVGHRAMGMELDRFLHKHRQTHEPIFLKTHDGPDLALEGEKTIYIVRDGRAASVSYRNYLRHVIGRPRVTLKDVVAGENVRFGHWSGHIESWQPTVRPQTLLVRFEDLTGNPEESIAQVGAFSDLPIVAEWRNNFETMRKTDPRFFSTGSNERNIALLDRDVEELFWKRHGHCMIAMGYAAEGAAAGATPGSNR